MSTPVKLPLEDGGETRQVSTYLKAKFALLQSGASDTLTVPVTWSLEYLIEVDLVANVLHKAYHNEGIFLFVWLS